MEKIIIILTFFISSSLAYCNLCVQDKTIVSCSPQLGSEYEENVCLVEKYGNRNNTLCYHWDLTSSENRHYFGDVELRAYEDVTYLRTAFNVSFSNIQWTELKMRFRHTEKITTCRNILISTDIPADKNFYFDCPWTDGSSEGSRANFEYEYSKSGVRSTRNFTFIIPLHEKLDQKQRNLQLFLYVDYTDTNHLKLMIQIPPKDVIEKLNLTDYDVYVFRTRYNKTEEIDRGRFSNSMAKNGFIEYTFATWGEPGEYYFQVTPFNHNDYTDGLDFASSYTPKIPVVKKNNLVICIVGVSLLIPVFLIIIFMLMRSRGHGSNTILFVYSSSHYVHRAVVVTFARLLKEWYNLNVLLDEWDIPRTNKKNAFKWQISAFNKASHIIFFIAPSKIVPAKDYIYKDLYELSLKLMETKFRENSSKKFVVVHFPYSKKEIPIELTIAKHYELPKEFSSFLSELRNKKFWERLKSSVDFKKHRKNFNLMLREANKKIEESIEEPEKHPQFSFKICYEEEKVPLKTSELPSSKTGELSEDDTTEREFVHPFDVESILNELYESANNNDTYIEDGSELEWDKDIFEL